MLIVRPSSVSLSTVVRSGMQVVCQTNLLQTGTYEYELNVTTVDCPAKTIASQQSDRFGDIGCRFVLPFNVKLS